MGSRVRIRLFHILHFMINFLFSYLKNSKSGVDDRGHRFRSGSALTNYPHAPPPPNVLNFVFQKLFVHDFNKER